MYTKFAGSITGQVPTTTKPMNPLMSGTKKIDVSLSQVNKILKRELYSTCKGYPYRRLYLVPHSHLSWATTDVPEEGTTDPVPMEWSGQVLPNRDSMVMGDSTGQTMGCTQKRDGLHAAHSVYFQCNELSSLNHFNILHLQPLYLIHLTLKEKKHRQWLPWLVWFSG